MYNTFGVYTRVLVKMKCMSQACMQGEHARMSASDSVVVRRISAHAGALISTLSLFDMHVHMFTRLYFRTVSAVCSDHRVEMRH